MRIPKQRNGLKVVLWPKCVSFGDTHTHGVNHREQFGFLLCRRCLSATASEVELQNLLLRLLRYRVLIK